MLFFNDFKFKHIWPGVMTSNIEHPLGPGDQIQIKLSVKDFLPILGRTRNDFPTRIDDAAAAAIDPLFIARIEMLEFIAIGDVVHSKRLTNADNEHTPFPGNMLHTQQPTIAGVPGWGSVDLRPTPIHGLTG